MKNFFSKPASKKVKKFFNITITKRQKFVIGVLFLSFILFISEYIVNGYGFAISIILAILSDIFLFAAVYEDMKQNFSLQLFILPFLYSFSFGSFYFLAPPRLLTRFIITSLYALGMYSLFLSENIFTVATIRTIALYNGAKIVSLIITLISYFFLTNIIFSLHTSFFVTTLLTWICTLLFSIHTLWTYTLEKSLQKNLIWSIILSVLLFELTAVLWFWPTNPTILALFLTGVFYILAGLTNAWLDKRLFRGVMWEYMWVAIFSSFLLIWFTAWQ